MCVCGICGLREREWDFKNDYISLLRSFFPFLAPFLFSSSSLPLIGAISFWITLHIHKITRVIAEYPWSHSVIWLSFYFSITNTNIYSLNCNKIFLYCYDCSWWQRVSFHSLFFYIYIIHIICILLSLLFSSLAESIHEDS